MILKLDKKIHHVNLTKSELSDVLGISRPTLDTRLERSNWKKGEIVILRQQVLS